MYGYSSIGEIHVERKSNAASLTEEAAWLHYHV